jgi:type IV pilus assembly protein PilA
MAAGVITATGTSTVDGDTFQLTPASIVAPIQWTIGGSCVGNGLC